MHESGIFIKIIGSVLGGFFALLGAGYAAYSRHSLNKQKEEKERLDDKFQKLWKRYYELSEEVKKISEHLAVLQGEHNALCARSRRK